MKRQVFGFAILLLLLVGPAHRAAAAALTTAFTYQGSIDRSGVMLSDSCTFQFKLYDAISGGAQVGGTITTAATILQSGQFSVMLDFGPGIFDGNQRWLEVSVHCPGDVGLTTLTPRQAITATPYALYSLSAPGGGGFTLPYSGALTNTAQDAFRLQNNATTGTFFTLHGLSATTSTNGGALMGEATGASGQVIGVYGKATSSPNGIGVIGSGSVNGGFFQSSSNTGGSHGVYGATTSSVNGAAGVYGSSSSTTGNTAGVWGNATASPNGTGVVGVGTANGGYFSSSDNTPANDMAGVYSTATVHPGVKGVSATGVGVSGLSTAGSAGVLGTCTTGSLGIGVQGTANGANSYGVYGSANAGIGVYGGGATQGVRGFSASGHGVEGTSNSVSGIGVWAQNDAGGVALYANGLAQVRTLQILGADVAESFPVREDAIEPGTVLAISADGDGSLTVCGEAYCRRVAGVVSGANGLPAGVVLKGEAFEQLGHAAVAMSGRVWVKCDATTGAIRVGDLLTSSAHVGFAMRAVDSRRATGAVLGKAMTALDAGTGMVLVLVNLQ